jgi:hypothetical protein
MTFIQILLVIAVVEHGLIAGTSFDVALVKLPTRKRIGAEAYARFARGNDLGNGLVVYPVLGILSFVLSLAAAVLAVAFGEPFRLILPLLIAFGTTITHSLLTLKAAPIMLSLRKARRDEKLLERELDRFAFWHGWRALFQGLTFVALVWALVTSLS